MEVYRIAVDGLFEAKSGIQRSAQMTDPVFNVLVIGAGSIGAFYDAPGSDNILTHAHAFSEHPGFRLLGFVDPDGKRATSAAQIWDCKAFATLEEAFADNTVDIACIAAPDELHYPLLKALATLPVKAVFAEKPLTRTLAEAREISGLYVDSGIPVCVNYRRSFVPAFETLRAQIREEVFGAYLSGTAYYGKGLLHNGSHLVHLISYLLGEITDQHFVASENDCYPDDPSISTLVRFNHKHSLFMSHIGHQHYTIFELDLLFESGRVRIVNTGLAIEYHIPIDGVPFKGYRGLAKSTETQTLLNRSLYFAAENIYNHLTRDETLKCSLRDALETIRICDMIQTGLPSGSLRGAR